MYVYECWEEQWDEITTFETLKHIIIKAIPMLFCVLEH